MQISLAELNLPESHPSREEMIALNIRRLNGDEKAREEMILRNYKLIFEIIRPYQERKPSNSQDYWVAGMSGLIKAVDRFDHTQGAQFSTYACLWIRQKVSRWEDDHSRVIRLPVYVQQKIRKLRRLSEVLRQKLKRTPTIDEISEEVGIPRANIEKLFSHASTVASLDEVISDESDTERYSLVPDRSTRRPDSVAEIIDESIKILEWLREFRIYVEERFPPQQFHVFYTRFGIFGKSSMETLEETGRYYGITRERVRQICDKIFRRRCQQNLILSTEIEFRDALDCLQSGIEASFASTGKVWKEAAEVFGAEKQKRAPRHSVDSPPKDKTKPVTHADIVQRLRTKVGQVITDSTKVSLTTAELATTDFNVPSEVARKFLNVTTQGGNESDIQVLSKIRSLYDLAIVGHDIEVLWKRQGRLFDSQKEEAGALVIKLRKDVAAVEKAIPESKIVPAEMKEALISLYGLNGEEKADRQKVIEIADIQSLDYDRLMNSVWDLLVRENGLAIRSDSEYQKALRVLSLLEIMSE